MQNNSITRFSFTDEQDAMKIKEGVRMTKEFFSNKEIPGMIIGLSGEGKLARMLSAAHLGTLTSIYLAERLSVDAASNDIIEEFKKKTTSRFY